MPMPANLRAMTVGALQSHAKEQFGEELTGTKAKMLAQLRELYAAAEQAREPVKPGEPESGDMEPVEPGDRPTPDPRLKTVNAPRPINAALEEPDVLKELVPDVVPHQGASIKRWPDSVEYLLNPATGKVWPATDALRERLDLLPCRKPRG